jgi:hypothetical protein
MDIYYKEGTLMKKIVAELKQIIDFKDTTEAGDVVLIASKEPQMLIYAYVLDIVKDTARKDEWWNLQFKMLSVPLQKMTWTLRTPQMTGQEIFTMGGDEVFFKAIDLDSKVTPVVPSLPDQKNDKKGLRRVK